MARESPLAQAGESLDSLAFWTKKIQYEFAWRIHDGEFDAIGVDISNGVSSPEGAIPSELFDSTIESFSISWDENRLSVFGRTIAAIRIAPSEALLQRMELRSARDAAPVQPSPLTRADFPSEPGATSYEQLRAEAILYLFRTYPNFEGIKLPRRLVMMCDYIDTNHPDVDTSRGFDRSSYYSTVKYLRSTGQLPSKNVQE